MANAAARMRLLRERRREGVVCMCQIPIYVEDIQALVKADRLKDGATGDRAAIAEAVEYLLDAWGRGEL